jgi:Ras homolog gene family, member A
MYNRHYRFEFYDTAAPENYTLLNPDFLILCYAINDRRSLINAQQVWRRNSIRIYMTQRDDIPVMLLGLKRDLRVEEDGAIYPQEVSRVITVWFYFGN